MTGKKARVFVAGHRGLVGGALLRELASREYTDILVRDRNELDLRDQPAVRKFFEVERPSTVFLAAAKVGGIHANNTQRWEFLRENLEIQNNVIGSAFDTGVERFVFLGSSCIYPRLAEQPIKESALLTGPLEPTNEPYAIAKIAGLKMIESACAQYGRRWVSLMPTNLYGPGDNFEPESSHVLPGMIRKFHDAKVSRAAGQRAAVTLWGSGTPLREFLYVDDLARACCDIAESPETGLFNVGSGQESTIAELAELIRKTVGYDGPVEWDKSRQDGTPRKLLDSARITRTGWRPKVGLEEGIQLTYRWFLSQQAPRAHS